MKDYIWIIIISIIAFSATMIAGSINDPTRLVVGTSLYFAAGICIKNKRFLKGLIVYLPFLLVFTSYFVLNSQTTRFYENLPLNVGIPLFLFFGILIDRLRITSGYKWFVIILFFTFIPTFLYFAWLNYFNQIQISTPKQRSFPAEIDVTTIDGKAFDKNLWKGKVVVLDLWSQGCKACFEQMPKFRAFAEMYRNNEKVQFYSLYLPMKGIDMRIQDSIINQVQREYTFNTLKAIQSFKTVSSILGLQGVPVMLVLNDSKIVYMGPFNIAKTDIVANAYKIVDRNLKQ